jgi:hypothetical protein
MTAPFSRPRTSVAVLALGGSRFVIAPYRSLRLALISLGLVLLGLVLVDRIAIPRLGAYLPDAGWEREDACLVENMKRRNDARFLGDWVWRSRGRAVEPHGPKERRILVMGDSFVWGDGYANLNDLWWMQLQRALQGRGYRGVEVIAAGIMGAATHHQLEQARSLVPRYRPDLVIWGHVVNDPDEGLVRRLRVDVEELLREDRVGRTLERLGEAGWLPALAGHLRERRGGVLAASLAGEENGFQELEWRRRLLQGENLDSYRRTLAAVSRFHDEVGIPGLGVQLPVVPDREELGLLFSPVSLLYADAGLPMVDVVDAYLARYPGGKPPGGGVLGWGVNPANGHPGAIATSFHAERTADYLELHHSELLGPRSRPSVTAPLRVNDWVPHFLEPESRSPGSVTFSQPDEHPLMRYMPVGWPYVQLNLELPTPIGTLTAEGSDLAVARAHVTVIDPVLGYDDGTVYDLGEARGRRCVWSLEGRPFAGRVNTIGFAAGFSGVDREVTLTASPPAAQP